MKATNVRHKADVPAHPPCAVIEPPFSIGNVLVPPNFLPNLPKEMNAKTRELLSFAVSFNPAKQERRA